MPIYEADVVAHIWRVDVGRVPLFLLDTDVSRNGPLERWITARLYDGRPAHAAGAVRAARGRRDRARCGRSGIDPGVIHLNEGHAALAPLALAASLSATATCRRRPSHGRAGTGPCSRPTPGRRRATTPIRPTQVGTAIAGLAAELGIDQRTLIALGRNAPRAIPSEPFGVTQAALRLSRAANGVSRRHGEVAREMWARCGRPAAEEVPIGHVTNGVHVPDLDRAHRCGSCSIATWAVTGPTASLDPDMWEAVDQIPDERAVGRARRASGPRLVEFIRARSTLDRLAARRRRASTSRRPRSAFDHDVLTIGFARRVATYKRLDLLTRDPRLDAGAARRRAARCRWSSPARPTRATRRPSTSLQRLFGMKARAGRRPAGRVPRRLRPGHRRDARARLRRVAEPAPSAAGGERHQRDEVGRSTAGLQLSVLDGWWAEAYDGEQRLGDSRATSSRLRGPGRARRDDLHALLAERGGARRSTSATSAGSRCAGSR